MKKRRIYKTDRNLRAVDLKKKIANNSKYYDYFMNDLVISFRWHFELLHSISLMYAANEFIINIFL